MFQDSFTAEDWRTLRFAPFWVTFAVAGADHKIEPGEVMVIAQNVAAVASGQKRHDDPLVQELFESIGRDPAAVMQEFRADSRDVLKGLDDVAAALGRGATPEQAGRLKAELLRLGVETAGATETKKKGLLGRFRKGEKVSDEETAARVAVTAALEGRLDALQAVLR